MHYLWSAAFLSAMLTSVMCNVQFNNPTDVFQPLATIQNDRNSNVDRLAIALNAQGQVEGIRFYPQGAKQPTDFTNADMASQDGANLEEDSHKPIMLHANFGANANQADFVVDYLSNGIFGSYTTCKAEVVRDAQGTWHLVNTYTNTPVTQIFVKTWSLGISTIEGICPADN